MATKTFPFITFEYGAPPRPLVPFDFPKGKNVFCLVDSGASTSLMREDFMRHEELSLKQRFARRKAEGICGNQCVDILGISEPVEVGVVGLQKTALVSFEVVPNSCKLTTPIIGQNFFEHLRVGFGKENGILVTIVQD